MSARRWSLVVAVALACAGPGASDSLARPGHNGHHHKKVCSAPPKHFARCHAEVVTDASGTPQVTSGPDGYGPFALQSAYGLSSASANAGTGMTIAVVEAYDDPNAESDLAVYRAHYGLPACHSAKKRRHHKRSSGCFTKVNETGGRSLPQPNAGWAQETALDLDVASAICPRCRLLLVEANSPSLSHLGVAENYAATHANVVSNSFGTPEFPSEESSSNAGPYYHPGVPITVSAGDAGYPDTEFPAVLRSVTAVGGTHLERDASTDRGWSEKAWSEGSSGCSAYVPKPFFQADTGCQTPTGSPTRTVADVSAVADPATGVAVYNTYKSAGWLVFGGTSVAAPLIAATYALAGNASNVVFGSYPYAHPGQLNDVTAGSNGTCDVAYLCNAQGGFDGPTGLGTPSGTGAF